MRGTRVVLAVLALAVAVSSSEAAQSKTPPKKGIVKITVTKPDKTPASKVLVKFYKVIQGPDNQPTAGTGSSGGPSHKMVFKDVEKQVGAVTTNENGEAEIKTLLVGSYKYRAGNPVIGPASGEVTVDADTPAKLEIALGSESGK